MRENRLFYWILARDPETGRPHLVPGGYNEQEARQKGLELLPGIDFEIRGLRTTNMARASAMIRGVRLEETHSLHKASEKLGHERSVKRMIRRRMLRGN